MLLVFRAPPLKRCQKWLWNRLSCFQRNACLCSWMSTLQFMVNSCVFCLETQVWHGEDFPSPTDIQCLPTSVRVQEDTSRGLRSTHGYPAGHTAGHPVCVWHCQGRQTAGHYHHQREQQLNSRGQAFYFLGFLKSSFKFKHGTHRIFIETNIYLKFKT